MVSETAMDSRWYKDNDLKNRKRHTLHSLGVGFVFFLFLYILTKIFSVSLCPIKAIFGITCPGCGMTRGFMAILNFDFKTAYEYNVLSVPIFLGIAMYAVFAIIDIIFDKNYVYVIENKLSKKYMYFIYAIILIISVIMNNYF